MIIKRFTEVKLPTSYEDVELQSAAIRHNKQAKERLRIRAEEARENYSKVYGKTRVFYDENNKFYIARIGL